MANRWSAPFDPFETKDYSRDWTAEMEATADRVATAEWALPEDAAAASLAIASDFVTNGMIAVVWFRAGDPAAFAAAFAGKEVEVGLTVTTSSSRVLHETCILKVRAK